MQTFANYVNSGNTCAGLTFKLAEDIDFSQVENFTAIGNDIKPFKGTFDGDNHTIKNLTINNEANYQGLFGYVVEEGTIKNLSLENANVTGKANVGGVVGHNDGGTVSNVFAKNCTIKTTTDEEVGALVGKGTVAGYYFNCNISNSNGTQNGGAGTEIYSIEFPSWVTANFEDAYKVTFGDKTYYTINATVKDREIEFGDGVTLSQSGTVKVGDNTAATLTFNLGESADAKYTENQDTYTSLTQKTPQL